MRETKKTSLSPRLRFPEFPRPWESVPLSELAESISDRVGTTPCIPYTVTSGVGLLSQEDKFGRTIAGNSLRNYIRLKKDDFAYNKSATKAFPEGYIARHLTDANAAVPNSIFTCFRADTKRIEPAYLDFLFAGNLHGRWLRKFLTVGARAHGSLNVNDDDLMALAVPLPSPAEQRKIAACLGSLDAWIGAESAKLEALRRHKKGLMQQLFPRPGESRPRLRFPEFHNAGEWEVTTLNQLVDIQSGGTPSKVNPAFWNGSIPWVSAKDMKRLFLEDAEDHISDEAVEDGTRLVPSGTLLMLTRGMTLLKDVPICVLRREMAFNQDVKALRPKRDVDSLFLAFSLLGNKPRLLKMVDIAGHGTGKLNTDELEAFELASPSPAEQQRIAACLSSLDGLLSAASWKVEALKQHKKGLMQQLFPSGEVD